MEETIIPAEPLLQIDEQGKIHLAYTARWGRFIAVVGIVACGLLVLLSVVYIYRAGTTGSDTMLRYRYPIRRTPVIGYGLLGCLYFIGAVVHFFPSLYLLQFSDKMKTALLSNDQETLTASLQKLKTLFRYYGILLIVMIVFYLFIILAAIVALILR